MSTTALAASSSKRSNKIAPHKGSASRNHRRSGEGLAEAHPSALLAIIAVAIFVRTISFGSFVPLAL